MYWLMVFVQMLIVIAVGWTGIYFKVPTSGLVLGMAGVAVAWLLTVAPVKLYLWCTSPEYRQRHWDRVEREARLRRENYGVLPRP
jgi:hypothetical protein